MNARNDPGAARSTLSIQPAPRSWRQALHGNLPGASQIATPRSRLGRDCRLHIGPRDRIDLRRWSEARPVTRERLGAALPRG